ncbi:hypothetical protein ACLQ24_10230 [Micromonospora sp. DT4]|uniref:hypothetical protein n=1 Tax=Micromonospora sp. DT4 TaxID=3393438 RepID=UPI003CF878EE
MRRQSLGDDEGLRSRLLHPGTQPLELDRQQPDPALLAAIEQHSSSGQTPAASAAAPTGSSAAPSAPPAASNEKGGCGALLMIGGAVAADGTWSVPRTLARPGGYRVYADLFVNAPDGRAVPLVLGVDHHVPGVYAPAALPPARAQATAGPFTVSMTGTPTAGVTSPVRFQLTRSGAAAAVPGHVRAPGRRPRG